MCTRLGYSDRAFLTAIAKLSTRAGKLLVCVPSGLCICVNVYVWEHFRLPLCVLGNGEAHIINVIVVITPCFPTVFLKKRLI